MIAWVVPAVLGVVGAPALGDDASRLRGDQDPEPVTVGRLAGDVRPLLVIDLSDSPRIDPVREETRR